MRGVLCVARRLASSQDVRGLVVPPANVDEAGLVRSLVLHAPPTLRLVLSARRPPALQLARLRVSGELADIDGADLACTAEEAVADADIVTTATNSATPVVMASWLKGGAHVNGVGANAANRRELDPEIVLKASLVVTDDIPQAKTEAGEFIDLVNAGKLQ